jgi:antitoxin component YwqK of YwqJK toxin-antitoxin module
MIIFEKNHKMKYLLFSLSLILLWTCNSKQIEQENNDTDTLQTSLQIKPNHKCVEYYKHGQIKFIQEYFNGIKHGIYKNWYENGTIRTMGIYHLGFRKGLWNWYNEKGKLEFQVNYDLQMAAL